MHVCMRSVADQKPPKVDSRLLAHGAQAHGPMASDPR